MGRGQGGVGWLYRGGYGDVLAGASFVALGVGVVFVVVGFLVGDSIFARVSSLLIPCGLVGVADYYADKAEGSPVVWRQAGEPGTVVLRHRPYRALPMTVGLGSFGGVITLFGAQQGDLVSVFHGAVLCAIVLILTVLAVAARRSAYLVLSPAALRQRNFLRDREFDWHMISDISAAEEDHGDVITITCDRSGVRQYRRVKFSGWRRDTGRPDGTLKLPALSLGVESVGLYEALICLQRDPALRERLSPELMTELLIDGFESPVLDSRADG